MKIDLTDYHKACKDYRELAVGLRQTQENHMRQVMNHVVIPLLEKYNIHRSNPELKGLLPRIITSIYQWYDHRTVEDRVYGRHGYRDTVSDADRLGYNIFVLHDADFLTHEESYGGMSGSFWWHDPQEKALWKNEPFYFNDSGLYIYYEIADLEEAQKAFEDYYFAKINAKLRETKQFDLF